MENLGPVGRMGAYLFGPDVLYDVSAAIPEYDKLWMWEAALCTYSRAVVSAC